MTDREKLIALYNKAIQYAVGICAGHGCDTCRYGEFEGDCCEAAKVDYLLANGVVVREKGEWKPCFIYTGRRFDSCTQGVEGWECSNCGYTTLQKFDFCICGADMRKENQK